MNEREIFSAALQQNSPEERKAFLDQACGGDQALRRRVEELLRAHEDAGSFLKTSPPYQGGARGGSVPELAQTVASPLPELPSQRIGPYKLLQQLGEGGMGVVYLAEQEEPVQRKVALKIIKPGMDSRHVLARFEAERQALAMMDHPNIAKILDAGVVGDVGRVSRPVLATEKPDGPGDPSYPARPYFVMELVKGIPITKFCDQAQLTPKQRLELFLPVCRAIHHAHQKGIIHRDLKPSNVLVAPYDGRPVPKIIDFGVAKALHQRLTERTMFTEVGQIVGTLEYMAPEQAELNNLDIDTRADIYSLGVILYELLAGSPPFTGQQLREMPFTEMLRTIREVEPPIPSSRLSTLKAEALSTVAGQRSSEPRKLGQLVRGELDWLVMKALEKDRNRRYESASAFAADVERYLADEPVEACPPSAAYRLRKFLRRNKAPAIAVSLILLTLIGGAVGTTIGSVRAVGAEKLAKQRLADVEEAKAETDQQAAITREVNEFVNKYLLGQADIANQPGGEGTAFASAPRDPDIKVRTLLDRAAKTIEGKFPDQPLTEAAIRLTIGDTYRALGEYDEAQIHLERSTVLRAAELGGDHPDTLVSRNSLATLYSDQGKYDLAEPLFKDILDRRPAKLGADDLQTLTTKNNLAVLYVQQAKYDLAEALFNEVLEATTGKLSAEHHDNALVSKKNLAGLYAAQGKYSLAESLEKEVLEAWTVKLGADHPQTLRSKNDLARRYLGQGKYDLAGLLLKEVIEGMTVKLGAEHPQTLASKHNLVTLYLHQAKYDLAEPLLKEIIKARTVKLGADHHQTLASKHNLASLYSEQGKYDLAEALLKEVLNTGAAKLGADHPMTLTYKNSLALVYHKQRKYDRAEPLYKEALDARTVKLGADHPDTLSSKHNLATLYQDQRKYERAEPLLKEVVDARTAKLGADHPDTLSSKNNLATVYQQQGKYDRAEPLYKEALEANAAKLGAHHPFTLTVGNNLATLYNAQEKYDRAEPLLRELAESSKRHADTDSPQYATQLAMLGLTLLAQKKFAEAEKILRECLPIREKTQPDEWTTFNTKSLLGGSLLGQKKYAEAAPLLVQGYEGMKQREAKIPPPGKVRLTEALERLVQLYEETNKPAEAAKWRKELEARQAAKKQEAKKEAAKTQDARKQEAKTSEAKKEAAKKEAAKKEAAKKG